MKRFKINLKKADEKLLDNLFLIYQNNYDIKTES